MKGSRFSELPSVNFSETPFVSNQSMGLLSIFLMETNHYIVTDQISSIGGTFLDSSWNRHKSSLCDMLVYNDNNQVFNNFGC